MRGNKKQNQNKKTNQDSLALYRAVDVAWAQVAQQCRVLVAGQEPFRELVDERAEFLAVGVGEDNSERFPPIAKFWGGDHAGQVFLVEYVTDHLKREWCDWCNSLTPQSGKDVNEEILFFITPGWCLSRFKKNKNKKQKTLSIAQIYEKICQGWERQPH